MKDTLYFISARLHSCRINKLCRLSRQSSLDNKLAFWDNKIGASSRIISIVERCITIKRIVK
ncbi:hypothetical protein D3C85_1406150 [compost metagenome]